MRMRQPKDIGELVRVRREELGLTQQELARRIRTTRQFVIGLEQGSGGTSIKKIFTVFQELGIVLDTSLVEVFDSDYESDMEVWPDHA